MAEPSVIKTLREIPGVGPSIAKDLYDLGIREIEDLKGKDAEILYRQSNELAGCIQDRCLLYVFRCAVYFAKTPPQQQESDKLKWWHWKG